jgi:glutaredoxin-related protein
MTETAASATDSLARIAHSATVVLFVSNLTDARPVTARLEAASIPYHTELMGMGDPAMRQRFQDLEAWTGWGTLPQVFVDGSFIGGIEEALAHPRLAPASGSVRRWARLLGYGGLIPFVALALALAVGLGPQETVGRLLTGYGAVILSFLGAVHWGRVLAGARDGFSEPVRLGVGVLPALAAWGTLAAAPASGLGLQAAAFAAVWAFDMAAWRGRAELAWYRRLRGHLTLVAFISLLAGALSLTGA